MKKLFKSPNGLPKSLRDFSYRYSVSYSRYLINQLTKDYSVSDAKFSVVDHIKFFLKTLGNKERFIVDPWLNYLLVRTRIYDSFYEIAVSTRNSLVVNLGCGFEKRFASFGSSRADNCRLLYFDRHINPVRDSALNDGIEPSRYFNPRFEEIDLDNVSGHSQLFSILSEYADSTTSDIFIYLEGVTPYLTQDSVESLLSAISKLPFKNVYLLFDYKLLGFDDEFGASSSSIRTYRLHSNTEVLAQYFGRFGFSLQALHTPASLYRDFGHLRMSPNAFFFDQDCIIQVVR